MFDQYGYEVSSLQGLKDDQMLFLVLPDRLFVWPGFHVGHKVGCTGSTFTFRLPSPRLPKHFHFQITLSTSSSRTRHPRLLPLSCTDRFFVWPGFHFGHKVGLPDSFHRLSWPSLLTQAALKRPHITRTHISRQVLGSAE